jgi:hypothetical protein
MESEQLLPQKILQKASLRGHEYAWYPSDVKEAILAAKQSQLAMIGAEVQFRLPDGTCELYWLGFDASPKLATETWPQFVERSAQECLIQFEELCKTVDFVKEGIEAFEYLRSKAEIENINSYLCFVLYFDSEESYEKHQTQNISD